MCLMLDQFLWGHSSRVCDISCSFSPMEFSVTDFSAPIGASVFKFCVHLQVGKSYCVNENKDANPYFAFFFHFSFFPSVALI